MVKVNKTRKIFKIIKIIKESKITTIIILNIIRNHLRNHVSIAEEATGTESVHRVSNNVSTIYSSCHKRLSLDKPVQQQMLVITSVPLIPIKTALEIKIIIMIIKIFVWAGSEGQPASHMYFVLPQASKFTLPKLHTSKSGVGSHNCIIGS